MVYNVKVQGNPPMTRPITVSYDLCYDDYHNEWSAVGAMITAASVDSRDVAVTFKGIAAHGWPVVEIKCKDEEIARRITAAYMGIFDINDQEVVDYIHGEF